MLLYEDHPTATPPAVVYTLAFSPDGATLASGSRTVVILRDADGRVQAIDNPGPKAPVVHAVAYLPDGVLVIGHEHGWHEYRRAAGVWESACSPFAAPTTSLAVLDAATLAVGTGERHKPTAGTFELWDRQTRQRIEPFYREPNGVLAVAACPAKGLVAWATGHKKVSVWDVRRQTPTHFMQKKNSPALAFAPDGSALAAAVDWTVMLYDLDKRRERAVLKGHKGMVWAVAFSPDGATVATGSWDGTVRLWEAATGHERIVYKWPVGKVYALAYAPDGLRLAAGGDHGAVVVWDTE